MAPVALNNDTITLTKDVALMSPNGFSSSNELTILSSSSTARELAWIVPSDAPGVTWTAKDAAYPAQLSPTCSASLSPNISMSKLSSLTNVKWMIYTPCFASLSFDHKNFEGQIIAGAVDMSTGGKLKWANMGISGAIGTGGASTPATLTVTLTSRYDVSG